MSYGCEISFKQIKPEEIYPFLQRLKEEASKVATDIIKDKYIWLPIYKWAWLSKKNKALIKNEKFLYIYNEDVDRVIGENEDWITRYFSFRWYWDSEKEVIMLYGIPKQLQHLFDNTVYFQNSCDRDYDFERWSGIQYMEDIVNKWKNMSDEEFIKLYKESSYYDYDDHDEEEYIQNHLDYYRRTMCYDEIWDGIEWTLYDDKKVTYIALFSKRFDYMIVEKCNIATIERVKEDIKEEDKKGVKNGSI